MVDNDNNPSDGKKQNIQPEKKVVVYSPRGKFVSNKKCISVYEFKTIIVPNISYQELKVFLVPYIHTHLFTTSF